LRIKAYILAHVQSRRRQRLYLDLSTAFFLLMLIPLAGQAFFGWKFTENYPWAIRFLYNYFAVWVFGSSGCSLALLGHVFFSRTIARGSEGHSAPISDRRDFIKKGLGLAAAAPFFISGYGVVQGRHRFQIDHFEIPINDLSSDLSHLTVVQLSDIHLGPFMPAEELAGYVDAVNRLKPDLVVLTGDFVDTGPHEAFPCVETLAGLRSQYGVFVCLGNHDVLAGADDALTDLFRKSGVGVLRNDAKTLRVGNSSLNILGIDDLLWGGADLPLALKACEGEAGEVRMLLSHRPEIFQRAAGQGVDMVLSGHYHGGQVKLAPFVKNLSIARLITPYAEGLFHLPARGGAVDGRGKDSTLFVSRGIGITGLPIRINCPPQIAHLRLVNQKA
jgi:hypothetical protein